MSRTIPFLVRYGRPLALVYGALMAALLTYLTVDSARLIGQVTPGFLVWDNGALVAFHSRTWTGNQAGLTHYGQPVVSVDGVPFTSGRDLVRKAAALPPGTPITYGVDLDGELVEVTVPTMRLTRGQFVLTFGNYILNSLAWLLVGALALAVRPDLLAARSLLAVGTSFGLMIGLAVDFLTEFRFFGWMQVLEIAAPVTMAHFALVFPSERVGAGSRRVILGGLLLLLVGVALAETRVFTSSPRLAYDLNLISYVSAALVGLYLVCRFGYAFFRAPDPLRRAQVGVVFAGAFPAVLLPSTAVLTFTLLDWPISSTWWTAFMPLFPLALGYAVLRHDTLGAERVIRLSVGYTVATSVVVLGYASLVSLVERLLWTGFSHEPAASFGLVAALALFVDPIRRRAQVAVDRAFFRTNVDLAKSLEQSGAELVGLSNRVEIERSVRRALEQALDVEWTSLELDSMAPAPGVLELPVRFQGETLGVIRCGPKRSGAPFSQAQHEFAAGIASQAALALHNASTLEALWETQRDLMRKERLAAIGEFASAVVHGIRNPLASIRAAAQSAPSSDADPELAASLASVVSESDRLEQRVRSLLDFTRPRELEGREKELERLRRDAEKRASSLETKAERLAKQIETRDRKVAEQQATVAELRQREKDVKAELRTAKAETRAAQSESTKLAKTIERLETKLANQAATKAAAKPKAKAKSASAEDGAELATKTLKPQPRRKSTPRDKSKSSK